VNIIYNRVLEQPGLQPVAETPELEKTRHVGGFHGKDFSGYWKGRSARSAGLDARPEEGGEVHPLDELLEERRIDVRQSNLAFVVCGAEMTGMVAEESFRQIPYDEIRGTDDDL
jgi:hypothetical protein